MGTSVAGNSANNMGISGTESHFDLVSSFMLLNSGSEDTRPLNLVKSSQEFAQTKWNNTWSINGRFEAKSTEQFIYLENQVEKIL